MTDYASVSLSVIISISPLSIRIFFQVKMFQFILDKVQTCSHRLLQSTSFGQQCVFNFHESNIADKFLPGSKPSVLCEMASLGLPIPPGK